jgi:hypothetical protein
MNACVGMGWFGWWGEFLLQEIPYMDNATLEANMIVMMSWGPPGSQELTMKGLN